jgi:hypothetical protein
VIANLNLVIVVVTDFVSFMTCLFFQIKLDSNFIQRDSYDECNALVIPSQKRRTKKKNESVAVPKILSKSQRKRLQKIVDKKKKKENVGVQTFHMQFVLSNSILIPVILFVCWRY